MQQQKTPLHLLYIAFFLSGATALIYEVVWTRQLTILFGATTLSVTVVLSAYMLGLALGGLWGSRIADQKQRPVLFYGALEVGIAISAGIVGSLLIHADRKAAFLAILIHTQETLLAVKFILSIVLLALPTIFMGATLPALSSFLVRYRGDILHKVGTLYGLNTLGAVIGCFASGFILIPAIGLSRATLLAVSINLSIGIGAMMIGRKTFVPVVRPASPQKEHSAMRREVLIVGSIVGFSMLALEVIWTRGLVQSFFGTTYSFTVMLTSVLVGIALGGFLAKRFSRRWKELPTLGALVFAMAASSLLIHPLLHTLPRILDPLNLGFEHWTGVLALRMYIVLLLLLPPTTASGAAFVIISKMASRCEDSAGEGVGSTYVMNTLGALFGAPFAEFVLLEYLGPALGTVLVCGLLAVASGYLIWRRSAARLHVRLAGAAAFVFCVLFCTINPLKPSSIRGGEVIFETNDPDANVKVCKHNKDHPAYVLRVNNRKVGGTDSYYWKSRFGMIPIILSGGKIKTALAIGLGTGMTYESLARISPNPPDLVELVPSLAPLTPFFTRGDLTAEPYRSRIAVDDGRNRLLMSEKKYDLIFLDVFHPDSAGISNLYSMDFYQLCRQRLTKDGMVAQWISAFQMSPQVLDIVLRTFASAFPHSTFWAADMDPEIFTVLLLGTNTPQRFDLEAVRAFGNDSRLFPSFPEVGRPEQLLALYLNDGEGIRRMTNPGEVNTDDRPLIEFIAPRTLWRSQTFGPEHFLRLWSNSSPLTQPMLLDPNGRFDGTSANRIMKNIAQARMFLMKYAHRKTAKHLLAADAMTTDPNPMLGRAMLDLAGRYVFHNYMQKAHPWLERARSHLGPNTYLLVQEALVHYAFGEWGQIVDILREAMLCEGVSAESARMLHGMCTNLGKKYGCLPGEAHHVQRLVRSNALHDKLCDLGPVSESKKKKVVEAVGSLASFYESSRRFDLARLAVDALRCYLPGPDALPPASLSPLLVEYWPRADCFGGAGILREGE